MLVSLLLFVSTAQAQLPGSVEELLALAATRSSSTRPNLHDGTTDRVYVNFGIDRLGNIDQVKQEWYAIGFLRTWWHDARYAPLTRLLVPHLVPTYGNALVPITRSASLSSHSLAYNATAVGSSEISLRIDQFKLVWQPDLYWEKLEEISGVTGSDGYGEVINIYPTGAVWRSQQRKVVLACPINLALMPFDTQTCHWLMGIYSDRQEEVEVQWKAGRAAIEDWETACPTLWLPIAQRQENKIFTFPSGNYVHATTALRFLIFQSHCPPQRYPSARFGVSLTHLDAPSTLPSTLPSRSASTLCLHALPSRCPSSRVSSRMRQPRSISSDGMATA